MELHLAGKTALVTGGSAGIGRACATALYGEGVSVVIAARDSTRLNAAVQEISASTTVHPSPAMYAVTADMSDPRDVERLAATALAHLDHIDILVNNAGAARAGAFGDLPDDAYEEAWTLKVLGYIRLVRAVAPQMRRRRDGRIVNIVGGAGRTPGPTFLAGSTANAALLNFTRGVARDLARDNIRVNAISPGATATARATRLAEQNAAAAGITPAEMMARTIAGIPLGRLVDPAEIAALMLLLVSDLLPSMTGAEVIIDGGQTPGV